jgi:hypothetical protein
VKPYLDTSQHRGMAERRVLGPTGPGEGRKTQCATRTTAGQVQPEKNPAEMWRGMWRVESRGDTYLWSVSDG